ncbi:MAG TPA: SDR family oxidoreductase [Ktedonobacterales bacterium]|nr:SDR family oxidoreductase [Ktedonobacterales bacterium]
MSAANGLAGDVLVVAGGATGIGAETAREWVARGGRAVIGDINAEDGQQLAGELGTESALFVPLDVRSRDACDGAIRAAVERFGSVKALLNTAIKMNPGPLLEQSDAGWNAAIDVGLTGYLRMGQAFARWLIAQGKPGAIVNISSIGGIQPYDGAGPYSVVKAGVTMLTDLMAIEWAPYGIRANAIAPGPVLTPLTAFLRDPAIREARARAIPLGRIGAVEDIAPTIVFLLSDDASWITAEQVTIDGGVTKTIFKHLPGRVWGGKGTE